MPLNTLLQQLDEKHFNVVLYVTLCHVEIIMKHKLCLEKRWCQSNGMTTCLALKGISAASEGKLFHCSSQGAWVDLGVQNEERGERGIVSLCSLHVPRYHDIIKFDSYIKGQGLADTDFHIHTHTFILSLQLSSNGILLHKGTYATSQEYCSKCKQPYSTSITFIFSIDGCSPYCYDQGKSTCHGKK